MATQLKQTDFHPIPFQQPKPIVRVAFSAGTAQIAIQTHMADQPAEVWESTLDELSNQVSWEARRLAVTDAITARDTYDRDHLKPAYRLTDELLAAGADAKAVKLVYSQREEAYGVLNAAVADAIDDLIRCPAPSLAKLTEAMRIGAAENIFYDDADEIVGVIASDIDRLSGGNPVENGAIVDAFCKFRDAMQELRIAPDALPDSEVDALNARMDEADMVLKEAPALTPAGVLMKLKRAFNGIVVERWSDHALLDPKSRQFETGLDHADLYEQMLWSAIEDLDRIGAVPTTPVDPHREWLRERNELITRLNADGPETDEEIAVGIGELNRLDNRIIATPATTSDGLLVQMVLVTQLGAEGHEVAETTAAELVTRASKLVGLGSLAGASRDVEEQVA
jgi:hypothetical protein